MTHHISTKKAVPHFAPHFPHLKPGGSYIIEDWGWAHWQGQQLWSTSYFQGRAALTNLLFEVSIACTSAPEIICEVRVTPSMFIVTRGGAILPKEPSGFDLAAVTRSKGRAFVPAL
jgi:hypothetical protein